MHIDTYTSTVVYMCVYELYNRVFMKFHSMCAGLLFTIYYLEIVCSQICGLHESVVVVVFFKVVLSVRGERT